MRRLTLLPAMLVCLAVLSASHCIENQPPKLWIQKPSHGNVFKMGESIVFEGIAYDKEDGPLQGGLLEWSSDRDGALGFGATLKIDSLEAGDHLIELKAKDSEGLYGSHSIQIHVTSGEPGF